MRSGEGGGRKEGGVRGQGSVKEEKTEQRKGGGNEWRDEFDEFEI